MTSPAFFSVPPINLSSVKKLDSRPSMMFTCNCSPVRRTRITSTRLPVKAAAPGYTTIVDEPSVSAKIGAKVRVKVPLKVYHIPKLPELELNGMEGVLKENVSVWKGKHISANFPYKIEFYAKIVGRDNPVKFFAHLKDDEFEYIFD